MRRARALFCLLPLMVGAGCYNTRIVTGAPSDGVSREERQWFTIGGLVPLSDPGGGECAGRGLARAESRLGVVDVLISIGVGIVGGVIGAAVCPLDDDVSKEEARNYGGCLTGFSSLTAFLIGSRTVAYECAGGAAGPLPVAPPR